MTRTTSPHEVFPNVPLSLKLLEISVDLEDISDDTVFARQVKTLLRENKLKESIKMIVDSYYQDEQFVKAVIGEKIMNNILSILKEYNS